MMRAIAVHPGSKQVGMVEQEVPLLVSRTGVKIRILEVGVCGTDKEICSFEYNFPPPRGCDYLILGHESLGEVVEVGPEVTTVAPGDLVVAMVRRPCLNPACQACLSDHQDFCSTGSYIERGIKEMHGFMTGFVVEDEKYVCKLPNELREIGVLTEPLTVAEKALLQLEAVQSRLSWWKFGGTAVVLGAGPVGILGAMALRTRGYRTLVYSREPESDPRAGLCAAMGVEYASTATTTVDQFAKHCGNIDVVYEATGYAPLSFQMLQHLSPNGVFIFTGIAGKRPPLPLDTDRMILNMVLKNQILLGTVNASRQAFENAIADLTVFQRQFPQAIANVISRRYTIDQHQDLLFGRAGGIKNVITLEGAV
jgi:threonine dehydrogenase-like Zn-dependent dehydrogenase